MKKYRLSKTVICLLLMSSLLVNFFSCQQGIQAVNLMMDTTPESVTTLESLDSYNKAITVFAVKLLKESYSTDKNTLVSPLSILYALAMTANGAKEDTLKQMESVIGMTSEEMNLYLYSYISSLPEDKKYKLGIGNSIWFADDEEFKINNDFLKNIATYYKANVYKTPFNDKTCKDINRWVKDKTDGMIENILDRVPEDAIMYLVNALSFDAEWDSVYKKGEIIEGKFMSENDEKKDVPFMYSYEGIYLEDEKASGFMKYYKDEKYAFVAMLPGNGVNVSGYLSYLAENNSLSDLLSNAKKETVHAAIPKFETEYNTDMSEVLSKMGITLAFDQYNADFSGMGVYSEKNIYVSRVLHKTKISVTEKGTRAGASSVVEMSKNCAEESKAVYLNRPFIYMIVDCENNVPIFIGTVMSI